MKVYKSDEGRQKMAAWYQVFLDQLEHPWDMVQVETSVGRTTVLQTGPEDAPVLLCLHGAMGTAPSALSLVQPLIPHFRVVFPDTVGQPGAVEASIRWTTV